MNEDQPTPEQPSTPPVELQQVETRPAAPPPPDPRRRMRELLAIPERDRTDANWDELVELEIQTAPGNRASSPQQNPGHNQNQNAGRKQDQSRRQDNNNRNKPGKRVFDKRRRGPGKPA